MASPLRYPRQHQIEAMTFHRSSQMMGTKLWHGMGLGKTLSSLWLAREQLAKLRQQGVKSPKFIVFCPKSAKSTWQKECSEQTPDLFNDMSIIPYSQMHNLEKRLKYHEIDVRLLVFDESHNLKSPETERVSNLSKVLALMGSLSGKFDQGRILLLSGTPMPNNAAEFYTAWALCCSPNLIEASLRIKDMTRFERWRNAFTQRKDMNWLINKGKKNQRSGHATKFEGVDHIDKLHQLLAPFVHFKRVADCIDLPKKEEIHINLELDDDKLLKNANIERPEAYMSLVERLAKAKTPHMLDWVRDFVAGTNEQLVVFAMNRHPIDELRKQFPGKVRVIVGSGEGSSEQDRAQNLKDFQEGQYQVLAMTYAAGSEALNLQNCRYALYHGWPWTDGKLKQAIARLVRSGQLNVSYHYFLTSGENDSNALCRIRAKEEATSQVENALLNGPSTPKRDEQHTNWVNDIVSQILGSEAKEELTVDDFI